MRITKKGSMRTMDHTHNDTNEDFETTIKRKVGRGTRMQDEDKG